MKPVVHTLGWFSDLVDIFKNSTADETTKITNSTTSTNAFNKLFENLGSGFSDVFEAIEQIGRGLDLLTQTVGEGLSEIYQHLRDLDRAILETRKIVETNRIAIFSCIGLLILFFIIAMARIGSLKRDNEELRNNVKKLDDKINSLTGMLQGFLIASRTTSNNNTSSQSQDPIKTPSDDSKEVEELPHDSQEELRQQLKKETFADESDKDTKIIIGFVLFCFAFILFAIITAALSNMK